MKVLHYTTYRALILPYFRNTAGLIVFIYFMMFIAVGRANEAGLFAYHFSLIKGMLQSRFLLILVFFAWFLYARKYAIFIAQRLASKEYAVFQILGILNRTTLFCLFFLVQSVLFAPISVYVVIIAGVGLHLHYYAEIILILFVILFYFSAISFYWIYLLYHPGTVPAKAKQGLPDLNIQKYYAYFLLRFLFARNRLLFLVIKLYSCGTLWLMMTNNPAGANVQVLYLFYFFGIMGHGILVYQFREFEIRSMNFYRVLPVSLFERYLQHSILYLFLLLPEFIILYLLTPGFLSARESILLGISGFGIVIFLNSLLFIRLFNKMDYLKFITLIFFAGFVSVLTDTIAAFSLLLIALSIFIFIRNYYKFE